MKVHLYLSYSKNIEGADSFTSEGWIQAMKKAPHKSLFLSPLSHVPLEELRADADFEVRRDDRLYKKKFKRQKEDDIRRFLKRDFRGLSNLFSWYGPEYLKSPEIQSAVMSEMNQGKPDIIQRLAEGLEAHRHLKKDPHKKNTGLHIILLWIEEKLRKDHHQKGISELTTKEVNGLYQALRNKGLLPKTYASGTKRASDAFRKYLKLLGMRGKLTSNKETRLLSSI